MIKHHELQAVAKLALPLMAAFLAQKGMQLIDTLMLARLGPGALASSSFSLSFFFTILIFCLGVLSSVGVYVARAHGANDSEAVTFNLQNGLVLALVLSIPGMVLLWFVPQFLLFIGEDPTVVVGTRHLLHALLWGFPGFLLFAVLREFVTVFALTRIVMFVTFVAVPMTYCLNTVFIYGYFGLPALGIAGIGCAGAIVLWFMFFVLFIYSMRKPVLSQHLFQYAYTISWMKIADMLHLGVPSGLLFLLESGMFLFSSIMIGMFGVAQLAAYQVSLQSASIAYTIPFTLGMTTAIQVGHAIGAKRTQEEIRRIIQVNLILGVGFSILIAIVFLMIPEKIAKLFFFNMPNPDPKVLAIATSFLIIAAFFQCLDAVQSIANGALRGLKDTVIPMWISVACYWLIGMSSAYLLAFHTALGAAGVWYGLTFGISTVGVALIYRLRNKMRKPI